MTKANGLMMTDKHQIMISSFSVGKPSKSNFRHYFILVLCRAVCEQIVNVYYCKQKITFPIKELMTTTINFTYRRKVAILILAHFLSQIRMVLRRLLGT